MAHKCNGGGSLLLVPRFVWKNFCDVQGFVLVETMLDLSPLVDYSGMSLSAWKQGPLFGMLCSLATGQCLYTWGMIIFTHSHAQLEVSSIFLEGQGLPVWCPPIWAGSCSWGVHEGYQGTMPLCEGQRNPPEGVPRWLSCPSLLLWGVVRPVLTDAPVLRLRFLFQQREIYPQALRAVWDHWHDIGQCAVVNLFSPPSHSVPAVSPVFLAWEGQGNSKGASCPPAALIVGWGAHVGCLAASWPLLGNVIACHTRFLELDAVSHALRQFQHSLREVHSPPHRQHGNDMSASKGRGGGGGGGLSVAWQRPFGVLGSDAPGCYVHHKSDSWVDLSSWMTHSQGSCLGAALTEAPHS